MDGAPRFVVQDDISCVGRIVDSESVGFLLSHPCHGEAVSWMGHPLLAARDNCLRCGNISGVLTLGFPLVGEVVV